MKKWMGLLLAAALTVSSFGSIEAKAAEQTYNAEQASGLEGTVWYAEDALSFEGCAVQLLFQYENEEGLEAELRTYAQEKTYNEWVFGSVTGATHDNVYSFMPSGDPSALSLLFGGTGSVECQGRYFAPSTCVWMAQDGAAGWLVDNVETIGTSSAGLPCYYITLVPYYVSTGTVSTAAACDHVIDHIITKEPTEAEDGIVSVKCTKCDHTKYTYSLSGHGAFLLKSAKTISEAAPNATVTITTNRWLSFNDKVFAAIEERPDVTVIVNYWYSDGKQGSMRTLTIPAGTKLSHLLGKDGFCGFEYIAYQLWAAK